MLYQQVLVLLLSSLLHAAPDADAFNYDKPETVMSKLDTDSDGRVSLAELKAAYLPRAIEKRDNQMLNMTTSIDEFEQFQRADTDKDTQISRTELLIFKGDPLKLRGNLTELFDKYDDNSNGFLEPHEFLGITLHEDPAENDVHEDMKELHSHIDRNGDGHIDQSELHDLHQQEAYQYLVKIFGFHDEM